jgi:HAMP domain-containing protein
MGRLFGNLNIKAKVLVGLAGVLVIMVVISGMAIWSFTSAKGEVETYSQRVKVVSLAGELDRDVLELRLYARDYGLAGIEEDAIKVKSISELVRGDIAATLNEIKETERHQRVEDISRRFDEYMHNFDRIQAQLSEQRRLIRDVMDPSGTQFQKEITALQDLAAQSGASNVTALAQSALEHGLLARLYENQMIGRRDASLGIRANAEFQTLAGLIANLEGAVTADAQQRILNEIKILVPQYRAAFQRVEELSNSNLDLVDRVNASIAAKFAEDTAFIRESGVADEHRIEEELRSFIDWSGNFIIVLVLTGLGFGGIIAWLIGGAIARPVVAMTRAMVELANGKLDIAVPGLGRSDEIGRMAGAVHVFKESAQRLNAQSWIKTNIAEISRAMQTAETPREFAQTVIGRLVPLLEGGAGVFHIWNPEVERLELLGSWGFRERKHLATSYKLGEGLVGQCALEKTPILLSGIPDDYIRISSGLGDAPPRTILVIPIVSKTRCWELSKSPPSAALPPRSSP